MWSSIQQTWKTKWLENYKIKKKKKKKKKKSISQKLARRGTDM